MTHLVGMVEGDGIEPPDQAGDNLANASPVSWPNAGATKVDGVLSGTSGTRKGSGVE